MPNVRRRFAIVTPTPGSVSTPASRRSGRAQPRGRGHASPSGAWTRPAKPVCARAVTATGTEYRTPSGHGRLFRIVEPEQADGTRPGVRADDGAETRRHVELPMRTCLPDHRPERLEPLRRGGVREREP